MCRNGRSSDLPPGIERLPVNLQQSLYFIITDWSYMNFQWHIVRPFHKGQLTAAGLSGISTRFPFNHP